jgi:hypothetical protein
MNKLMAYLDIIIESQKIDEEFSWIFDILTDKIEYTSQLISDYFNEFIRDFYSLLVISILTEEYELAEKIKIIVNDKMENVKKLSNDKLSYDDNLECIKELELIKDTYDKQLFQLTQ